MRIEYPRIPCWLIFDESIRKQGRISDLGLGKLGAGLDMTVAGLQGTVDKYNAYCAAKKDADFGRPASNLTPLGNPPYYAVNVYPGGPNTQGGPRKNGKCQAVRANDTVIKRLYVGGELSSLNTISYCMKNVSELFITGRIIGESAAVEKPWD